MATSYNTYDRYSKFRENGEVKLVPFVEVPKNNTDVYVTYELGKTRLDSVSYYYYSNPNYGWLILQANPQYGSLEFQIPDQATIRIPYPLSTALAQYQANLETYISEYKID